MSENEVNNNNETKNSEIKNNKVTDSNEMTCEDRAVFEKRALKKGIAFGILFSAIIVLACVVFFWGKLRVVKDSEINDTQQNVSIADMERKMEELQSYISKYYYYTDDIDMEELADEVYKGYISALNDKYSAYYTDEELQSTLENIEGTYCGIGAVVSSNDSGQVVIVEPYEGSPAAEAGLKVGDIILSIDGTELTGMQLEAATKLVKGKEGSSAIFKILRDGEEFEKNITRREVILPSVSYEMKEDNIGYVYISGFESNTAEQFKSAVDDLLQQGALGLIFDLRNNGGGLLDTVIEMTDYLLPEGLIMYIQDKYENRKNYSSDEACIDENIPMAVLINGGTASASEVFTGALQDYKRAMVFGTKSYGKGVVQQMFSFYDGSGLKLTTAEYFTPLGRNFNNNGIDPDEVVELPTQEEAYQANGSLKEEYDTQLNRAVEYIREQMAG